ncbi:MAG: hypothetical protein ACREKS_18810 [Candidatus Rokuibacteriota bacterium]
MRVSRVGHGSCPVIRIDGKLVREDLAELTNLCRSVTGPLVLDLSNLLWADRDGIRALVARERDGATLRGVSPLLALLFRRKKGQVDA